MNRDVPADWRRLAYMLLRMEAFTVDRMPGMETRGYVHERDLDTHLDAIVEAFDVTAEIDLVGLSQVFSRRLSNRTVHASESFPRWGTSRIMAIKAIKFALALAANRSDLIPFSERQTVIDLLRSGMSIPEYRELAARSLIMMDQTTMSEMLDAGPVDDAVAVEFRYSWRPWSGHGKGATHYADGLALAPMERLETHDAPVVMGLRTGTRLDQLQVRCFDGTCLRPILAPGTWRPIGVPEFRRAAREGGAWVDNPFLTRSFEPTSARLSLDDVVLPVQRPNRRDDQAREDGGRACLQRAGRLFAINGVVHKAVGWPRLHVVVTRLTDRSPGAWDGRIALAWSVGGVGCQNAPDLATWTGQDTFRSRPDRDVFLVDWASAQPSEIGFAPEMQAVLIEALSIFGDDYRNPNLRPELDRVIEGHGQPTMSDLREASAYASALTMALPPKSSAGLSTAALWRAGVESDIRRAFAESLSHVAERGGRELEADLDTLGSF